MCPITSIVSFSSVLKTANSVFTNSERGQVTLGSVVWTQFKLVAPEDLSAFLFLSISLLFLASVTIFFLGLLQAWKKIYSHIAISILAYLKCRPDLPVHPAKIQFVGTVLSNCYGTGNLSSWSQQGAGFLCTLLQRLHFEWGIFCFYIYVTL